MAELGDYVFLRSEHLVLGFEVVLILVLTYFFAKLVNAGLKKTFQESSKRMRVDVTQFTVLRRVVVLVVYLVGFGFAGSLIPGFSGIWVSLLASAGILAVVVGFAAQAAFSNIISGIFIALFEPFKVGDKIAILDEYGTVEDITLRHTVIKTWQEKRIVIPNSKISEESIINYSLRNERILGHLELGISYDSNIQRAREIMVEEAQNHPGLLKKVLGDDNAFLKKDELALVRLIDLTDFAQLLRLYYWAPDKTTGIKMKFDLLESIKERFDAEGIEIPFPYRTIVYKKDIEKDDGKRGGKKK